MFAKKNPEIEFVFVSQSSADSQSVVSIVPEVSTSISIGQSPFRVRSTRSSRIHRIRLDFRCVDQ